MARRNTGFNVSMDIEGLRELRQGYDLLLKKTSVSDPDFQNAIMDVGDDIRDKMKSKAPVESGGHWYLPKKRGEKYNLSKLKWIEPGALKRGIRSQRFSTPKTVAGFVATHYKMAPHAHLVEYGTGTRWASTVKGLISPYPAGHREQGEYWGMSADPIPEKPFFRPVVDEYSQGAKFAIEVNKNWTKAWNRIKFPKPKLTAGRRSRVLRRGR